MNESIVDGHRESLLGATIKLPTWCVNSAKSAAAIDPDAADVSVPPAVSDATGLKFQHLEAGREVSGEGHAASAVCAGSTTGVREFEGADAGRLAVVGQYPVPGRSREYNRRIAIHEGAGHAYLARCMGTELHSVSIIPGDGFEGRCLSKAYQSSLCEAPTDNTVEIVDLCERAQRLMPELGTGRVQAAEFFQRATVFCIELVGGSVAEQVLHPQDDPLPTLHDQIEAAAFAAIAVASPRAVPAFLEYAKGEARALINDHPDVAMAIADGLIEHGVLTGNQVDEIIVVAIARKIKKNELERRADWRAIQQNAANFRCS
jgi:hypothetical protein